MEDHAIDQLKQICLMTWEKVEVEGKAPSSFQKILQGTQETYSDLSLTYKKLLTNR